MNTYPNPDQEERKTFWLEVLKIGVCAVAGAAITLLFLIYIDQ